MSSLIEDVLNDIHFNQGAVASVFSPQVVRLPHHYQKDSHRVLVLDGKACQVHVILGESKKTIFLTPQPSSYPLSMLVSPDGNFLGLLTATSVHVVDISKLEPTLRTNQVKIIAKLVTVFDCFSGDVIKITRIMRVRWHPYTPNLLVILTSDGRLIFCRCICSSGNSVKFDTELTAHVLETSDNADKENEHSQSTRGLNLSEAMGAVCCDFDFGSPLFSNEPRFSRDAPLRAPIYVICENGDILLVSASPVSVRKPLVRFVRILPADGDYYTYDFDTILCLRPDQKDQPDIVCFANRAGKVFHGVCLHIPPSVLLQSSSRPQGRSVPILYLIDAVDLELTLLNKSFEVSIRRSDDDESEIDSVDGIERTTKFALLPASFVDSSIAITNNAYFCLHNFGIHHVRIQWAEQLSELYSLTTVESNPDYGLLETLHLHASRVEYLLLTQSLNPRDYIGGASGGGSRSVIGLLPHKEPVTATVEDGNAAYNSSFLPTAALTAVFPSNPVLVTVPIPVSVCRTMVEDADFPLLPSGDSPNRHFSGADLVKEKSYSSRLVESEFVKNCKRRLKAAESSRLPIMSSLDDGFDASEPGFLRHFLNATEALRSSQLRELEGLAVAVAAYASYAEAQVAAQTVEVAGLAAEREALHAAAAQLADRHAHLLRRQETLNHRLSLLARRVHSIDAGLTDAEVEMRASVQNLRDRLKSGLLGWLENIRLQYEHLSSRLREQQRATSRLATPQPMAAISSDQVQCIVAALRAEGSEINTLVKAVEKINLVATAAPPSAKSGAAFAGSSFCR